MEHRSDVVDEQVLVVVDGDLADTGSWGYVWISQGRVLYVGATGHPPAVRTWLHLHHDTPEVARVRHEHPEALTGHVEVRAFGIRPGLDRQAVRSALVARLDGRTMDEEAATAGAATGAEEILRRLGRSVAVPDEP